MNEQDDEAAEAERFRKALEKEAFRNIRNLNVLADRTGNPLYTWKALDEWFVLNEARTSADLPQLEVPQWCLDYLAIQARRLRDLAEGLDYRITPEPFGELPRNWESVERARRRKRTLSPLQATKQVLQALGFRRNGWNAFERARKLEQQDEDALSIEGFTTIAEMSEDESIHALLDDYMEKAASSGRDNAEITDSRSIRKRLAASRNARRVMSKPP